LAQPGNLGALTISVNMSAKQFYQADLVAHIERILADATASPAHIKLEVSEDVIMRNVESSARVLQQLWLRGIRLSIDDFGTGYSSLSVLHELPISTLKIDRQFVSELNDNTRLNVVSSILALARSMNVDALAEGVETAEQLQRLRSLGARYAQGFYFSPPVNADQATAFVVAGKVQVPSPKSPSS
jgi:EAL domain-containing protein (putative c-di-GMP-specific phosphodiesterase class I)